MNVESCLGADMIVQIAIVGIAAYAIALLPWREKDAEETVAAIATARERIVRWWKP